MNVDRNAVLAIAVVGMACGLLAATRASSATAGTRPRSAPHPLRATASRPLPPPRSVWDSVYTEEQAQRGEAVFRQECMGCHLETLLGKDDALPLAGDTFLRSWDGLSVFDLVDKIRTTMPPDSIGKVEVPQIVDVVAFLLRFNGYPAGKTELERDPEPLKDIRIEARKP